MGGDSMQNQHVLFSDEAIPGAKERPHVVLAPPKVEPLHEVFADAMLENAFAHGRHAAPESAAKLGAHMILPPPRVPPTHEMFAETMMEDATAHRRRGAAEPARAPSAHMILPPPKVDPDREVFAEAILEDTSAHQRRSPLDWAVSLAVHAAILSTLLILPLFYSAGLDFHKYNLTFLTAPVAPGPPPPPPIASAPRPARVAPVRVFNAAKLTAPTFIPKVVMTAPGPATPPDEALMGVPGGVPGGIPGGQVGGVLGGVLGGALKGVPAPPAPVAEGPKAPVRVGGSVKPPRLLYGPDPEYPILAKQSRISGVVVIEAIIDENGKVTGMRVVSGHPLLIPSALSAVSKRRYEPTILDGEPTPIDLRVEVSFSFS